MAVAVNQVCWVSLQPIAGAIENAYGIGPNKIASIGFIYLAVFLIMNFPATHVMSKSGGPFGGLKFCVSVM
jgi:hypothetical protein